MLFAMSVVRQDGLFAVEHLAGRARFQFSQCYISPDRCGPFQKIQAEEARRR
jgi:hypothetical protein